MAPKSRTVTVQILQALLTRIGSASSGKKDVLVARLEKDVRQPRLFNLRPEWKQRLSDTDPRSPKLRIMSIDMGIKNLAYCHVEVGYPSGDTMKPTIDIIKWDKLNLVPATKDLRQHIPKPDPINEKTADADEEVDVYSLPVLSQTAYRFIQNTVLNDSPDIILIERQRWRSASSPAIQQWTVRVNTLEAMLWAILETLRTQRLTNTSRPKIEVRKRDYEVQGVDPKRVGMYWIGQHAKAVAQQDDEAMLALAQKEDKAMMALVARGDPKAKVGKKIPRSKAEKKAKIALLREWLSSDPATTASSMPDSAPMISFTIGEGAATARRALSLPSPSHSRKKKSKANNDGGVAGEDDVQGTDMKKLDDITDCCLQAAAYVAWESNRVQLWDVWEQNRAHDGQVPPLDEEVLKEMVEVSGVG